MAVDLHFSCSGEIDTCTRYRVGWDESLAGMTRRKYPDAGVYRINI